MFFLHNVYVLQEYHDDLGAGFSTDEGIFDIGGAWGGVTQRGVPIMKGSTATGSHAITVHP